MTSGHDATGATPRRARVRQGWPVYTRDGRHLGVVGDVHGHMFTVRAEGQSPYWVRTEAVRSTVQNRVELRVDVANLDRAKASVSDGD